MVDTQNLYLTIHPRIPPPPSRDDADRSDRKISGDPLWDLQEIINIAARHTAENVTVRMVTQDANREYENLLENGFDLQAALAQLLFRGRFKGSWWCKTSPAKDANGRPRGKGGWIPCDAYSFTDEYEHPKTGYRGKVDCYFKLCRSIDNTAVLFVSLHL